MKAIPALARARAPRRLLAAFGAGILASALLGAASAQAEDLHVMNSGGFTAAYKRLLPKFEAASGDHVDTAWGPSMGKAPEAIPNRLARGESADAVIMVGYALDDLIKAGKVRADSRVDLADSRIGVVVRAGEPVPDVSTPEKLKAALLAAGSVAYSDSASGVYVERELFRKLGIAEQMRGKAVMVQKTPVAEKVAAGDYALGLQQVSELLPVKGVAFAGKIPESLQSVTRFAGGVPVNARHPEAARKMLMYMAAPAAAQDVEATGLDALSH
ncbi:substrate-binding domain-containing protein [Pandoraea nosoerga]|uniref:Aconitate isomerase n=1 Tax=Pandoraea nosoerga TaxID=2508296 RepID=A0A5E4U8A5_9BURK|nr:MULTISPECIES: substrate-binding domain-containing protein [Pandoraea]MBN4667568.1 substrate-binding domain-containing protein [Pandoraea nosoerga]MBN4676688.1 substrate-binding domain-containing protein [Pandoraea nosoerga]MBN4682896.1 substrate-binding domain-containing protein [Pandoraea nosoerga]MBN4746680.1 substrate-binding domain-containing protein [Pandoraea nosoerga]VVD96270.1 Aconitate isomerase [Pandoraea nosoerga]